MAKRGAVEVTGNGARSSLMQQILADIANMAAPAPAQTTPGLRDRSSPAPTPPSYINASEIRPKYAKPYLAEESDVEIYVEEMKQSLLAHIRSGKRVIV